MPTKSLFLILHFFLLVKMIMGCVSVGEFIQQVSSLPKRQQFACLPKRVINRQQLTRETRFMTRIHLSYNITSKHC